MRSARRASWQRATWAISIRYRATAKWSRSTPTAPRYGNTTPWQKTAYTSRAKSPILRWTPTGTVYWVAHGYGGSSSGIARLCVRRRDGFGALEEHDGLRPGGAHRLLDALHQSEHGHRRQPRHQRRDPRIREGHRPRTPQRPPRPTAAAPPARSRSRTAW